MALNKNDVFGEATNTWFDRLTEYSKKNYAKDPALFGIYKIVSDDRSVPNRRRLEKVIALLKKIKRVPLRRTILRQANGVLNGEYCGRTKQFRLRFNKMSPLKGQCSATSEFFSMLSQSIEYGGVGEPHADYYRAKIREAALVAIDVEKPFVSNDDNLRLRAYLEHAKNQGCDTLAAAARLYETEDENEIISILTNATGDDPEDAGEYVTKFHADITAMFGNNDAALTIDSVLSKLGATVINEKGVKAMIRSTAGGGND